MTRKITAMRNFWANGVEGYPGKELSDSESKTISNLLEHLQKEGLILVEETQEPTPEVSEAKPKKRRKE
jgi:hypothetical protein